MLLFVISLLTFQVQAQQYDLVLINGKIVDGTGNSWYYGDVAVKDGKIAVIGKIAVADARKVIDVKGLVVAPGFIDVHTHIEGNDLKIPCASL